MTRAPDLVSLAIRPRPAWDVLSERVGRPLVDARGALLPACTGARAGALAPRPG